MKEFLLRIVIGLMIVMGIGSVVGFVYFIFDVVIPEPYSGYIIVGILIIFLLWLVGSIFRHERDDYPKYP